MVAFLDPAKPHLESGLYFEPPHGECFRLEHCAPVRALKGQGLAEMDFAWRDAAEQTIHLLEVRDYSLPERALSVDFLVHECVQKATDCLLMLVSVWHDLPAGPALRGDLPDTWHAWPGEHGRLSLTFVLKTSAQNDRVSIAQLETRVRDKLKGRLELLHLRRITTVRIMDHQTARQRGVPIQSVEDFLATPVEPIDGRKRGKGRRR